MLKNILTVKNQKYTRLEYSRRQVRDCIEGSNAIKRGKEIYLPMPSGMTNAVEVSSARPNSTRSESYINIQDTPWYHSNPAYRAYLQRARFPDISASVLRGLLGLADNGNHEIDLPNSMDYFKDAATLDGMSLAEMHVNNVSEVLQTGKACMILDPDSNNNFRIALKTAESNIDWRYENAKGERKLVSATFIEEQEDEYERMIEYKIVNGIAVYQRYVDGKEDGEEEVLMFQGKTISKLPIFFIGSVKNDANSNLIPLLGITDIALAIYRKDADLSQAEFMTCNPTLFIYGITEDQKPKMVGSSVCVTISNGNAKAEYPRTDTSGLGHVSNRIKELFSEAVSFTGQLLSVGGKNAESAEALSIRQASAGTNLLKVVTNSSKAISDLISFAMDWAGINAEYTFKASTDFSEVSLDSSELKAILDSWIEGAISHDTLLDNYRKVNIVSGDVDNKSEKEKIQFDEENKRNKI